ncbi:MAG: hypothetical protein JKY54_17795 [Flavobacteriales bacterium]|nr:hypothetical protein [Flavobacteriales bacterium]
MKFKIQTAFTIFFVLVFASCQQTSNNHETSVNLSQKGIDIWTLAIEKMNKSDQKYRNVLSLGTLNDSLLRVDKELRKTASLEEYFVFMNSVTKTITKEENDSIWKLQHKIDYENYLEIKSLTQKYGYPSQERLGKDLDIFPILVHPPLEIEPQKYLEEVVSIFKPEVMEKRMNPKTYAMLYDNIKGKILKDPQLYGTNGIFNSKTMKVGNPLIESIEATNIARKEIGLPELKEGEYELTE